MVYLFALIGFLVGGGVVYFFCNRERTALRLEVAKGHTQLELLEQQKAEAEVLFQSRFAEQRELYERQLSELKEQQEKRLVQQREQVERQLSQQREEFEVQLKSAQQSMTLVAQQVLERNAEKLKEVNVEHVGHLTDPLKEALSEMRRALEDTSKDSARDTATLRQVIQQMMESNREIGAKADSLVNVLRRDNKAAGNMGEVILGDLLASQGLVEGEQYEVQPRLRDANGNPIRNEDTGAEMQPDVILHYPQGQDAIIDSKVSLVAYEKYVNAQTPEEKAQFLKEHIDSVRKHVNELARKDYSKYVKAPREAVDFVIMFMPFESSLQIALAHDTTLWHEAFEKKVFITSEQNLVAILHMIHVAWVQNQQAENQKKVYGLAEQLLDRLGDFIVRYHKLGEHLKKVGDVYEDADKKLIAGNQSVVKKGRELVNLGAKENPNRRIPEPKDDLEV